MCKFYWIRSYLTKKRLLIAGAVAAVLFIIILLAVLFNKKSSGTEESGTQAADGDQLFAASAGGHTYGLWLHADGDVFLVDGEAQELFVSYTSSEKMLDFSPKATDDPPELSMDVTGEDIYHVTETAAERYLGYLLTDTGGHDILAYVITGSYCDYYLKGPDGNYRYLYIRGSGESGTVIFTRLDDTASVPNDLSDLL
jgi:hypothetical protein